jgi:hypothetical protein
VSFEEAHRQDRGRRHHGQTTGDEAPRLLAFAASFRYSLDSGPTRADLDPGLLTRMLMGLYYLGLLWACPGACIDIKTESKELEGLLVQ